MASRPDTLTWRRTAIKKVVAGLAEQYTVNGLAPQPLTKGSEEGKLDLGFGHIPAGERERIVVRDR